MPPIDFLGEGGISQPVPENPSQPIPENPSQPAPIIAEQFPAASVAPNPVKGQVSQASTANENSEESV